MTTTTGILDGAPGFGSILSVVSSASITNSTAASPSPTTLMSTTTTGMLDGAPWLEPSIFCDLGSAIYPTVSLPATITDTARLCAFTSLNPLNAITPKTTGSIPTDRPGYGGVPGCRAVSFDAAHQDCPFGTDGWCQCGEIIAPPLAPTKSGLINCAITIQPTANSCPVNTAYSSSLAAASASASAARSAAASVSAANAKATSNTVSSFACPTDAVSGGPNGFGPGESNQETLGDAKGRRGLWANFNTWGCDMPNGTHNDAAAEAICGNIPSNTVLGLGSGEQQFYANSTNQTADDKNCHQQFYNMAFTVKENCKVPLTKDYCLAMYKNINVACPLIKPHRNATWEGGIVTDNCGIAYFTSGVDIMPYNNNPFYDKTDTYWWE